jgi:uncharacterized protein YyaL (SSP411 family)
MADNPFAHAYLLAAVDFYARQPIEIVVVARGGRSGAADLLGPLERSYQPNRVVVCYDPAAPPARVPPFAREKPLLESRPTAYVCHAGTCSAPVTDWNGLSHLVAEQA